MTMIDILFGKDNDCKTRKELSRVEGELREKFLKISLELEHGRPKLIPVGEEWSEVIPNVYLKELVPYISHEKTTVMFMNAKKGSESPLHRHDQKELIHLISGKVQEIGTDRIYSNVGDFFVIDKGDAHGLRFLEDTILILQWIPKI